MITLSHYDVIRRPVITEKSTAASEHNKVIFQVAPSATKLQIKAAVEELFNVRVAKVRTQNRKGKVKRDRRRRERPLSAWKKAIVTLHPDSPAIEFF